MTDIAARRATPSSGGPEAFSETDKIAVRNLDFYYGDFHALTGITVGIKRARTSRRSSARRGCGKSTFLRCLNRMNDLIPGTRSTGKVTLDGADIYAPGVDPVDLRRRVGMIFQQPNPFPMSIYDNVAFGPRLHGREEEVGARRHRRGVARARERLERGQGHPGPRRADALRRPAAAAVHRARARGRSPRSCSWTSRARRSTPRRSRRIEDLMAELKDSHHDHHRHAQHAAGGARERLHRVLPAGGAGRAGRARSSSGARPSCSRRPKDKRTEDYITGRFG